MARITNVEINAKLRETRESQDKIFELMAENALSLKEIHITLAGTKYERTNGGGGLVADVKELKSCNTEVKLFMERTKTRNRVIWIVGSAAIAGLWALFIAKWNTLFK